MDSEFPNRFKPAYLSNLLMQDYYEILKLSRSASQEEIRQAYLKLAREYHPDLNPDDAEAATQRFQAVNEAYSHLSDPTERELFDRRWAHFEVHGPQKTQVVIVRWEGPGAKYRREKGGRKRYFSSPFSGFGRGRRR